ncbi:MAG: NapC/NirT family cytochrome c [Bacteroidales bacterium]|nr:NapC/NirT family cytochrome c [Bacteroidales bacterium]
MKLPRSYYNLLSLIGTAIAGVSFFMIMFLFIISFFWEKSNSYLGLFIYIIIPAFLVIGLLIIPLGMIIEMRRRKKRVQIYLKNEWPVIDLNISKYRNAILIFGIGALLLLLLTGLGSYEAFHYTESVEFCGKLCHEVMKPEYTAYQNSPHARVTCVECHVGSGAGWYVRSKLSGIRQVYAVTTNNFSRPIATPIHNLRPARETCEQCHWPQKFYSRQLRNEKHFLSDSMNTEWNISLQMKIGPSHSAYGLAEGIHWHINPNVKIDYISTEDNREEIPWVRYTNLLTGQVTIFKDTTAKFDDSHIEKLNIRGMDCIDCHNRPSHHYATPAEFIDYSMTTGAISKDLHFIKKATMKALVEPLKHTTDSTLIQIDSLINSYYKENKPWIYASKQTEIKKSIEEVKNQFCKNVFPEMKASWDVYPDHIGHKTYNGCFRCHNDTHISENGKTISKDCNLCHTIVLQGKAGQESYAPLNNSLEFVHPKDIGNEWKTSLCTVCHRNLY